MIIASSWGSFASKTAACGCTALFRTLASHTNCLSSYSMASGSSHFQTQAMPAFLISTAYASTARQKSQFSLSSDDSGGILTRRLSSLGCSTSSSSSSGGGSGSARVSRQRLSNRRLPFAAVSLHTQEAGAGGSIGQLRWLSNSSSSSSSASQQPAQMSGVASQADIEAAARAATAPDVFKAGDVLGNGRYRLLHKLGRGPHKMLEGLGEGRFATLWSGLDLNNNTPVVLKLVEAGDAVSYTAGAREAALHAMAGRHPNVVPLLDAFDHRSSNGRHACMVLEQCGSNLLAVATNWGNNIAIAHKCAELGITPLLKVENAAVLRSIAKQVLQGLDHLHSRGIAHMDLSTDNIVLDKPFKSDMMSAIEDAWTGGLLDQARLAWDTLQAHMGQLDSVAKKVHKAIEANKQKAEAGLFHAEHTLPGARVKLLDFGRAAPFKQLAEARAEGAPDGLLAVDYNRDGVVVMSDPGLRPPEELLALDYVGPAYDMWRLGCIMFNLSTGSDLCDPEVWANCRTDLSEGVRDFYDDNHFHLLELSSTLGGPPRELVRRSPVRDKYFRANDQLRVSKRLELINPKEGRTLCLPELLSSMCKYMADPECGSRPDELRLFTEFLTSTLAWDPLKRPSAATLLQHKWLQ